MFYDKLRLNLSLPLSISIFSLFPFLFLLFFLVVDSFKPNFKEMCVKKDLYGHEYTLCGHEYTL